MSALSFLLRSGRPEPYALLRSTDNFGIEELDLASPPRSFWADESSEAPRIIEIGFDRRRLTALPGPVELLRDLPDGETWAAMTRRSLARLAAWFLVAEDRQARLRARPIATLAHQASLVDHVLSQPKLRRVLIADEVGLGKTVEAGLIVKRLLEQRPGLRILYLAPARLVANVRGELDRLGLSFRQWVAGEARDANLGDALVVASIHRAVHEARYEEFVGARPWDVLIVDECHHLSDWEPGGGSPVRKYRLVRDLVERQPSDGRLILMSGTPHQGHRERFENLLRFLRTDDEPKSAIAGRVIYRTKDDVRDWEGAPIFPSRQVNEPRVIDLGAEHRQWLENIHDFYVPPLGTRSADGKRRAAGWRCAQALQWATSSVEAGLGYLVRQAIRADWKPDHPDLRRAIETIRPYRLGSADESVEVLFSRMEREVGRQRQVGDVDDIEDSLESEGKWEPDPLKLAELLREGVAVAERTRDRKWDLIYDEILRPAGEEKVVLFAQPIETVTALARYLERRFGQKPALIIGNQEQADRDRMIEEFWRPEGPQFLVSSKAGGEGLNLQVARRVVHVDVPWNPMDMEQRVGRVHRFGSRRTILVDTVVAKDSREVDMYRVAREKLMQIASSLVPEDRLEGLFSRVMALVPPEDLQVVLERGALAPLSQADQDAISDLVSQGFEAWQAFHERFRDSQIEAPDPGLASWSDVAYFARSHAGAEPAEGFTSLRFAWREGEVVDASVPIDVLRLRDDALYACGETGGMPITNANGDRVEPLGLNVPTLARALRDSAFTAKPAGAAHMRWPDGAPLPNGVGSRPFAVWVAARRTLRVSSGPAEELGSSIEIFVVPTEGEARRLHGVDRSEVMRGLLRGVIRREAEDVPGLVGRLAELEPEWEVELRRPSEADRADGVGHAVTPLLAAVVA